MKIRTIILFLVIVVMAIFLILNWQALMAEQPIDLVYTTVHAPLGAIVVIAFAAIIVLLLIYMVIQQASVTLELRAASKEARQARQVAEDAEKSRLVDFKKALLDRMDTMETLISNRTQESLVNLEKLTGENKAQLEQLKADVLAVTQEAQTKVQADVVAIKNTLKSATPAKAEEAKDDKESEAEVAKKKEVFTDLF